MFSISSRLLLPCRSTSTIVALRYLNNSVPIVRKNATDQVEFIKSETENGNVDWPTLKSRILELQGSINMKNINAVLLKLLISNKKKEAALSFFSHLKSSSEDLSIGTINAVLALYYEIRKERKLTDDERQFIIDTYNDLYDKYKVLDFSTCEKLLHALCAIDDCKRSFKVLDNIHDSYTPSHSAYNILIATLFKNNKKAEAMKLIQKCLNDRRSLQDIAYEEWINYILRKYKENKTKIKYLEEICLHIARNSVVVSFATAELLQKTYNSLGWNGKFTTIRKANGQCTCCQSQLDCLKLTQDEFQDLQKNIKDKLIVGSDLFLKTSPEELQRFQKFVERTAPYDVVLDALNICYASGKGDKLSNLKIVVDYFRKQNKNILVLGRRHMLKWKGLGQVLTNTQNFFTEDLSQDDPYFITAAILSGSHTDIVSKDLLRGHRFILKDEQLRMYFRRWQWQHQWMIFVSSKNKRPLLQPPLSFTPCAQTKNGNWHLPYENEETTAGQINDGIPNLSCWLCLRSKTTS